MNLTTRRTARTPSGTIETSFDSASPFYPNFSSPYIIQVIKKTKIFVKENKEFRLFVWFGKIIL